MSDHKFHLIKRGASLCLNLFVMSAIFLQAIPAQSQDKREPRKTPGEEDVIKVSSHLVNLDVVVKDKKGKAITDLKAEDFVLSENGVRQNIEFFDSTLANESGQGTTISVSTEPREPNSLPRNIISLVLDGQTTEGANLKHVRDGMTKYIRERISDSDSVALICHLRWIATAAALHAG